MLNRRQLRVKAMQSLYAYFQSGETDLNKAYKHLLNSINKTYYLYLYCLQLIIDIAEQAQRDIEQAKQKHLPSQEELHPNLKFVNNKILKQLSLNNSLKQAVENYKINWFTNDQDILKQVFRKIKNSAEYKEYIHSTENSYKDDKAFILKIIKKQIHASEALMSHMEEKDIFWVDDFNIAIFMLIQTIQLLNEKVTENSNILISIYKNEKKDMQFIKDLFNKTILNKDEYEQRIAKKAENWEADRIALIDKILMKMAICEIIYMPSIPLKVTLNEYIELAKRYSSPKSKDFINGILDKLLEDFRKEDKFKKIGRGLKDN